MKVYSHTDIWYNFLGLINNYVQYIFNTKNNNNNKDHAETMS